MTGCPEDLSNLKWSAPLAPAPDMVGSGVQADYARHLPRELTINSPQKQGRNNGLSPSPAGYPGH
jgi:hypothetical protein